LPNLVFKLDKVLYGLKQAHKAWYEHLSKFLIDNGFRRGKVGNTLFLKSMGEQLLIVQYMLMALFLGQPTRIYVMNFQN